MATLRKIKGNYYARVRWSINYKQQERIYPLLAEDDGQADLRLGEVEEKEHLIKQEIEIAFWWLIENGERTHQVIYTLAEAVEEFLQHLSRYGRKQSTIEIRRQTFNHMTHFYHKPLSVFRLMKIRLIHDNHTFGRDIRPQSIL